MPGYFDIAPFLDEFAFCIHQESAAFNAPAQFAIAFLDFHHVKLVAEDFFRV